MNHPDDGSSTLHLADPILEAADRLVDRLADGARPEECLEEFTVACHDVARVLAEGHRLFSPAFPAPVSASSAPSAAPALGNGDEVRIGPYRIIEILGKGGQGVVYRAEETQLRRVVALKVLTTVGLASADAVARFRREAEIASRLDHPNLCTVYGAGAVEGSLYIAMKLVHGKTLAQRIATARTGSPVPKPETPTAPPSTRPLSSASSSTGNGPSTDREIAAVLQIIENAAEALHAAHEAGIIHRDIKPGNIMVTEAGDPIVMDFGLARDLDDHDDSLTITGDLFGTPYYMSPEQLLAKRTRLDPRTDVYSLGVTLFEALTLQRPFDAPTRDALYNAIQTKEPPSLRRLNVAASSDLAIVVATAMEKDRDRRYQTAHAFAEDLRRLRERQPIMARPVSRLTKLIRWAQRNPAVASLTAVVFLLLTLGLTATLIQKARAEANAEESAKNAARAETNAVEARRNFAEIESLADSFRLADLLLEMERGFEPALPAKVPSMESWLHRARKLVGKLPGHMATLYALRAQAKPWTDEQRAKDREVQETKLLGRFVRRVEDYEFVLQSDGASTTVSIEEKVRTERIRASLDEARAALVAERARVKLRLSERLSYDFDDPNLEWRHEKLAELVERLSDLMECNPKVPGIGWVEERLAFAQTLVRRTILDHQEAWSACLSRIAKSAKYAPGTLTKPELGLIPLGPDPMSGLEEFAETAMGVPPLRDPATRRLSVAEATGVVFVLLPGGSFWMGSQDRDPNDPNYFSEAGRHEEPLHEVTLSPFFLSKYELTKGQWLRSLLPVQWGDVWHDPCHFFLGEDLRHPVDQVDWLECLQVLRRMSMELPTESQWEYGCRGGTSTPWWVGREPEKLRDAANLADLSYTPVNDVRDEGREAWDDGYSRIAPVGSFAANGFGLHDVHGNVWEWCDEWYEDDIHSIISHETRDPVRSGDHGIFRTLRGGSFEQKADRARSAARWGSTPGTGGRNGSNFGVRPARHITP